MNSDENENETENENESEESPQYAWYIVPLYTEHRLSQSWKDVGFWVAVEEWIGISIPAPLVCQEFNSNWLYTSPAGPDIDFARLGRTRNDTSSAGL